MPAETTDPQGNDRTAYTSAFPSSRDPEVDNVETGATTGRTKSATGATKNVGDIERLLSAGIGTAMILRALAEGNSTAWLRGIAGGALLFRGLTGQCQLYQALGISTAKSEGTTVSAQSGYKVEEKILIRRTPEELYRFWRDFENLPQIMDHLSAVKSTGGNRYHLVAATGVGEFAWDAEIFNEKENELIAWRSLPGNRFDAAGSVRFRQLLPSGHTEITVSLKYNPPFGAIGAQIESWLAGSLQKRIAADLRRFKETMEAGEESSCAAELSSAV